MGVYNLFDVCVPAGYCIAMAVKRTYRIPESIDSDIKTEATKRGLSENDIAIIRLSKKK